MTSLIVLAVLIASVLAVRFVARKPDGSHGTAGPTLQILVAMLLGFFVSLYLPETAAGFGWMGDVFLKMLKMIVVPLVVSSVIVGVSSLGDVRHLGRTGGRTLLYYAVTTGLAVALGIVLVNLVQPGVGVPTEGVAMAEKIAAKSKPLSDAFIDILLGFFSENALYAAAAEKPEMLPLIVFSLVFGAALTTIGAKGKLVLDFFEGVNEVILKIIHLILRLVPFGVFGLIAGRLGKAGPDFWNVLSAIGLYAGTVISGLLLHGAVVLPLILWVFARRNPWKYLAGMGEALMTAFSTASSSATYPLTLKCATENNRVSKRSAMFVLPIGATVNMDGTALYEAVAVLFIAQAYGIQLGPVEQFVVFVTATLAAIGAAGIPEAGLFTMVIVLNAVGLPLEGVSLILAVDWFLDRCRTTINVWGDAVGAAIIDEYEQHGETSAMSLPVQQAVPVA